MWRDGRWLGALSVALVFLGWYLVNALSLVPEMLLPGRAMFSPPSSTSSGTATARPPCGRTARRRCGAAARALSWLASAASRWVSPWGTARKLRAACNYIIQFMRPLPPLSYLILLILWLGTGDASKIALLYLTAFPIVASSAMAGVSTTKLQRIQAARSLGAGEWQIFRHVVFPSALPLIFTGARSHSLPPSRRSSRLS